MRVGNTRFLGIIVGDHARKGQICAVEYGDQYDVQKITFADQLEEIVFHNESTLRAGDSQIYARECLTEYMRLGTGSIAEFIIQYQILFKRNPPYSILRLLDN